MKDAHDIGVYRPNFVLVPSSEPRDVPASWGQIGALVGAVIAIAVMLAIVLLAPPPALGAGPSLASLLTATALCVIAVLGVLVWRRRTRA
jgi:uncharacterized membrane protein